MQQRFYWNPGVSWKQSTGGSLEVLLTLKDSESLDWLLGRTYSIGSTAMTGS